MKILAIETAGAFCSAALLINDEAQQRLENAPRRHADLILGMVDELLQEAGIRLPEVDAIAYGRGPGSFTGVRIAAAVVQGLAFGAGRPVVGISTLAATAHAASRQTQHRDFACALDARMGEVYWGCFRTEMKSASVPVGDELVVSPEQAPALDGSGWCAVGDGWKSYPALVEGRASQLRDMQTAIRAEARDVASLAAQQYQPLSVNAREALPVYLRNRVAQVPRR